MCQKRVTDSNFYRQSWAPESQRLLLSLRSFLWSSSLVGRSPIKCIFGYLGYVRAGLTEESTPSTLKDPFFVSLPKLWDSDQSGYSRTCLTLALSKRRTSKVSLPRNSKSKTTSRLPDLTSRFVLTLWQSLDSKRDGSLSLSILGLAEHSKLRQDIPLKASEKFERYSREHCDLAFLCPPCYCQSLLVQDRTDALWSSIVNGNQFLKTFQK